MASIGKFALSLASGVQETTVALANISLDFAMIRLEAPMEYQGLGTTLSKKRKQNAEEGSVHATARRLGALFADDMPPIPNLSRAYGLRASEIAEDPLFNPVGSIADGPLAGHVGADGTSIWAAATSGRGALHVHLLACFLARMWSAPEATTIWNELVTARKAQLEESLRSLEFQASALTTSRIELSRESLAEWDASARSWLRTGDKARLLQQKQLMLIVDNIGLPIPFRPQLFESVITAWKKAMVAIDKLVSGVAQHMQDPEVLVGLSAWHIYPDIAYLGRETTVVEQKDHLVQKGGLITVGMQNADPNKHRGISWTMPLAQLQYYGKPETLVRSVGEQSLRVSFGSLVNVAMGSIISTWKQQADDFESVCKFFIAIWRSLKRTDKEANAAFGWHELFSQQAELYLQADAEERKYMERLMNLGRRRFAAFMAPEIRLAPGYGLCSFDNSLEFLRLEEQIKAVRQMATKYNFEHDLHGGFIVYQRGVWGSCIEIASVFPYQLPNGNEIQRRWTCPITTSWAENLETPSKLQYLLSSGESISDDEYPFDSVDSTLVDRYVFDSEGTVRRTMDLRASTGELCTFLEPDIFINVERGPVTTWKNARDVHWNASRETLDFSYLERVAVRYGAVKNVLRQQLLTWKLAAMPHSYEEVTYKQVFKTNFITVYQPKTSYIRKDPMVPLDCLTNSINSGSLDKHLRTFFNVPSLREEGVTSSRQRIHSKNTDFRQVPAQVHCLFALYKASLVYSKIPNADIDLSVASKPLSKAMWARIEGKAVVSIPRTEAFACVAMLDTGYVNIDPSDFADVMAISSGNTLYVSEMLLNDPCQPLLEMGIRCLIGNIGRPGVALLMSPREPLLLEPSLEAWNMINHADFDGKVENNFKGTSLQLSLTGYEQMVNIRASQSRRFKEVSYVEAVVSAHDCGRWVSDLDVLGLYRHSSGFLSNMGSEVVNAMKVETRIDGALPLSCSHEGLEKHEFTSFGKVISVDNWLEFLDLPANTAVIRANGNWVARLALAAAMRGREDSVLFASDGICWSCVKRLSKSLNMKRDGLVILC